MNQIGGGARFRLPWWLIVGVIGFLVFGGWRGFFGAIFGVLFLPIILFAGLALIVILWAVISGKRFTRFPPQGGGFPGQGPLGQRPPQNHQPGDIIETEATVIKRDD